MKFLILFSLAIFFAASAASPLVLAQQLEIRRVEGGILQVQARAGLNLAIQPDGQTLVPKDLNSQRAFVLGTDFERTILAADGKPRGDSIQLIPGEPIPPNVVSIESALIGDKRSGIQLRTGGMNVLFASVDLMSDQGWITTHRDQDINLLVLTFKDAAKLQTARFNLWISLVKTQQIALNPTDAMSIASAEEFDKSIGKKRVLPMEVLPILKVPSRNLDFGDRQVILLKSGLTRP
jgi:hypothetical protein